MDQSEDHSRAKAQSAPRIRHETSEDHARVRSINELAFGRPQEAELVDRLRGAGKALLSLVAARDGEVEGHILFSRVTVESNAASFDAAGLGPMAVLPNEQGRGLGAELVRAGLRECLRIGCPVVVVLGNPKFYSRFGFETARPRGLRYESPVPDEFFMVVELAPGALAGRRGVVRYPSEFGDV